MNMMITLKERFEDDMAPPPPPSPVPSPTTSSASSELGSPGPDPLMKLSSSSTDDSACFDLQKLKEISENKSAVDDTRYSTPSAGDSSKSGEGSGISKKVEASDLAEKTKFSPPKSVTKVKKSVTSLRCDEAPDSVLKLMTSLTTSVSVPSSEFLAILMESPNESSKPMVKEAWERLRMAIVYFGGKPVGSLSAMDPKAAALNVSVRDTRVALVDSPLFWSIIWLGSYTKCTLHEPAASNPSHQGGSTLLGKRKRGEDRVLRNVRRRLTKEERMEIVEVIRGELQAGSGIPVHWRDLDHRYQLLDRVEGVEGMAGYEEFQNAVSNVLVRNNHPTDTRRVYYSLWTTHRLDELPIEGTPWEVFRHEVRGVHVEQLVEEGEMEGEQVNVNEPQADVEQEDEVNQPPPAEVNEPPPVQTQAQAQANVDQEAEVNEPPPVQAQPAITLHHLNMLGAQLHHHMNQIVVQLHHQGVVQHHQGMRLQQIEMRLNQVHEQLDELLDAPEDDEDEDEDEDDENDEEEEEDDEGQVVDQDDWAPPV